MHRLGSHGHRANGFFVTLVSDVEHGVALLGADFELVVHLGHEGTDRVNDRATALERGFDDLGWRTVRAQHHRETLGHVSDVVDEYDAQRAEVLDDETIVDDLVIAVDRWFEDPGHPVQRLDGLFYPGAEAPRRRQHYGVNFHASSLVIGSLHHALG